MLVLRVEAEMVRIGGGGAWEGPVFLGLDHGGTEVSGPLVTYGWDRDRRNQGVGAQSMFSWGRCGMRLYRWQEGSLGTGSQAPLLPVGLEPFYLTLISTQYIDWLCLREPSENFPEGKEPLERF